MPDVGILYGKNGLRTVYQRQFDALINKLQQAGKNKNADKVKQYGFHLRNFCKNKR